MKKLSQPYISLKRPPGTTYGRGQIQKSLLVDVQWIIRQLPQIDLLKIARTHLAAKFPGRAGEIVLGHVDRQAPPLAAALNFGSTAAEARPS